MVDTVPGLERIPLGTTYQNLSMSRVFINWDDYGDAVNDIITVDVDLWGLTPLTKVAAVYFISPVYFDIEVPDTGVTLDFFLAIINERITVIELFTKGWKFRLTSRGTVQPTDPNRTTKLWFTNFYVPLWN